MSKIVDNMVAYKLLKMLVIPFKETDAYKLGIIDEKGKVLRKASTLKTSEEQNAYNYLTRFVFNVKRMVNRFGGENRLKSLATAMFLIREFVASEQNQLIESIDDGEDELMESSFFALMDDDSSLLNEDISLVQQFLEEEGVTVAALPHETDGVGAGMVTPVVNSPKQYKALKKLLRRQLKLKESTEIELTEELNKAQKKEVDGWEKAPAEVRKETDHYFGKGVDTKEYPLTGTTEKSEIHKQIESHLGKPISQQDYKEGYMLDEKGRKVKIGKTLEKTAAPDQLKRGFENDSTRQAKKLEAQGALGVKISRHPYDVAGQTSGDQSWADQSCKNYVSGANKHYLPDEVKNGTVVAYLHDHNGKEIARSTLQPHRNDDGNVVYAVDSHYGIDHEGFKQHVEDVARELSQSHKGGEVYTKDPDVYDDNRTRRILHPALTSDQLSSLYDEATKTGKAGSTRSTVIKPLIAAHPNASKELVTDVLNNETLGTARAAAIKNPNATHEQIMKAIKNPNEDILFRESALQNPNVSREHIDEALEHPELVASAVQHKRATRNHIDSVLDGNDTNAKRAALENPRVNATQILHVLNTEKNPVVRAKAISHPNAGSGEIHAALDDDDHFVREQAMHHPKVTGEHIDRVLDGGETNEDVLSAAIRHDSATGEHVSKVLANKNISPFVKMDALGHENYSKVGHDQIDTALDDENAKVRDKAVKHPNASRENLEKALGDEDPKIAQKAFHRIRNQDYRENPASPKLQESVGVSYKKFKSICSIV